MAATPAGAEHDRLQRQLDELHHAVDHADAWNLATEAKQVSMALDLAGNERVLKTLSGGELRRVDLATKLLQHPDVTQAACVGKPDAESGEEVCAVVALRPGATVTPEELIEFSKGHLAKYKYPREIRVLDAVPLTSVGKTDRKTVRAMFRE